MEWTFVVPRDLAIPNLTQVQCVEVAREWYKYTDLAFINGVCIGPKGERVRLVCKEGQKGSVWSTKRTPNICDAE